MQKTRYIFIHKTPVKKTKNGKWISSIHVGLEDEDYYHRDKNKNGITACLAILNAILYNEWVSYSASTLR